MQKKLINFFTDTSRLGKIFGTEILIDLSFKIYFTVTFAFAIFRSNFDNAITISSIFVCVFLHELGHKFAAHRVGISTPTIIMSVFGGVARLSRIPTDAIQELYITICGPSVNVILAAIFLTIPYDFAKELAYLNIALALFNCLPAIPMDGGRILRACLSLIMGNRVKATKYAFYTARTICVLGFCFTAYKFIPMAMVIAVIMFYASKSEYEQAKLDDSIRLDRANWLIATK